MTTLLAHEWLAPIGGSENVFEILLSNYPDARSVCMWNDAPNRFGKGIEETWLARTPMRRSKLLAMPFMSKAWDSIGLENVDRVLASSHAFAHHLATRASALGIPAYAYVYSPARYVWAPEHDDRGQSLAARVGGRYFKRLDRRHTSSQVRYACISEFVRGRIWDSWGVDAEVIHPPVDVERIQSVDDWRGLISDPEELRRIEALPPEFVMGASRMVRYKRLDAAIEAGEALGLPVVLVGQGEDRDRLQTIASKASVPVTFFGYASTEALYALYAAATVFVFMAIEDFGIVPLEAASVGTRVLVNSSGGAAESISTVGGGLAAPSVNKAVLEALLEIAPPEPSAVLSQFGTTAFTIRMDNWLAGQPS